LKHDHFQTSVSDARISSSIALTGIKGFIAGFVIGEHTRQETVVVKLSPE
jgi:hypothetical protein